MTEMHKPGIGLALGSGGARGWAHLGALRALSELGIRFDVVCGTSIGALAGGFYLTGQLPDLEVWARRLTRLKIIRLMDFGLAKNGLIAGNRLFGEMQRAIGDVQIEDLPCPFASVATDLFTGHEVWLNKGSLAEAIRASFSLPGLFEPVHLNGRWIVDGAIVNPIPISVCHAMGAEITVAINLNLPAPGKNGGRRPSTSAKPGFEVMPRWPGTVLRRKNADEKEPAAELKEAVVDTPRLLNVLASTMNIVQDRMTRSRLAAEPPDVVITPKVGHVGLLDFYKADQAIEAGANAVYQAEAEIRDALMLFERTASA